MPVRTILKWPHVKLKELSTPIDSIDLDTCSLAKDLFDTMNASFGAGLAAIQVDVSKAICVIKSNLYKDSGCMLSEDTKLPGAIVLINPKIDILGKETFVWKEACLSIDDVEEEVTRYKKIKVCYSNLSGIPQEAILYNEIAAVVQHETDHLNGTVFIDRLSLRKQKSIKNKIFRKRQEKIRLSTRQQKREKREIAAEAKKDKKEPVPGYRALSIGKKVSFKKKKKTGKLYGKMKKKH
jgi:peptide deformylase